MIRELLPTVLRWRRWRIAAGAAGLLSVGLLATPQFDVLGFEAALACSLVLPFCAGALGAGFRRSGLPQDRPYRALGTLVLAAEILVAGPVALLVLNMLRAPVCDPLEGLAFFFLLPAFSVALAALAGWTLALAFRTPFGAALAWMALWGASLSVVAYRFMATPAVAFYGPFFGWYPGALYDSWIPVSAPLLTFRLTNLVEAAAALAVVRWALDPASGRLSARRLFRSHRAPWIVLPLLGAVALGWRAGPALGHRTSTDHIAEVLGSRAAGLVCDIHAPWALPLEDLRLLVEDCDYRVHQIRSLLGLPQPGERITVFVFVDEFQKKRLIGAGRISIAKPWRREVYVQIAGFPHPVLKHELAHVVAGEWASGPFRVSGRAGGWLPIPGLIEGAAVAIDWAPDVLSPHGWAAAMDRLGLLPDAGGLVGIGFLGEAAGLAYTAMGSFVRWLIETRGAGAFGTAYAGGDFAGAYGRTLHELWREWRVWLASVPLDPAQIAAAEERFDVPGFFEARCPHARAKLAIERDRRAAAGDWPGAIVLQAEICDLAGGDPGSRLRLAAALLAAGDVTGARRAADDLLVRDDLGGNLRNAVEELRADARWLDGDPSEALAVYRRLLDWTTEPAARRLLLAKIRAASDPAGAPMLRDYLLRPWTGGVGAAIDRLSSYVRDRPEDPIGHYLLGRRLIETRDLDDAEAALWTAVDLGLAPDDLRLEAIRLLAMLAYRKGDLDQAESDARALASSASPQYRSEGGDWLERIRWVRFHAAAPTYLPAIPIDQLP